MEEPSLKDKITVKQTAQGLIEGKTYTQIAEEMNITREALYLRLNKQDTQTLMTLEVRKLETTLQTWIQELHDSPNSANKRHATTELGKIVKHVTDKLYPSIFRHETVNINIDLTELQTRENILIETISRLPPTHRELFWTTHTKVKQEYR